MSFCCAEETKVACNDVCQKIKFLAVAQLGDAKFVYVFANIVTAVCTINAPLITVSLYSGRNSWNTEIYFMLCHGAPI